MHVKNKNLFPHRIVIDDNNSKEVLNYFVANNTILFEFNRVRSTNKKEKNYARLRIK